MAHVSFGNSYRTKKVSIDVSPKNALLGLCNHYLDLAGIPVRLTEYNSDRLFLENGKICKEYEEHGGPHSWYDTRVVIENPSVSQVYVTNYVLQLLHVYSELELHTRTTTK